jgi:branched-chain amino acid transport system ATP-binding protein
MITIKNLNAYYGDFHVLKDVNVDVQKGQIVVMLGPNGHGKSTFLKSVCGLVKNVSGEIIYDGENVTGLDAEKMVNKGITYIAENRELFPEMTVLENLKLGAYARSARQHEKHNLEKVFSLFPRLKDRQSQLASTMSGGEARMLAIARGLMSNARVLAIDEPSLGLQPNLRDEVARIIRHINSQGMTVLVVEQNIPQITELADKLYVIEEGRISFQGTREQALGNDHLKEIFLGM